MSRSLALFLASLIGATIVVLIGIGFCALLVWAMHGCGLALGVVVVVLALAMFAWRALV